MIPTNKSFVNFRLKNYFYHRRRGGHGGPRPRRSQAPANYFNPATIGAPTQADYFDSFPGEATAPAKVFRPRPWRGTTLADFFYPASAGAAASQVQAPAGAGALPLAAADSGCNIRLCRNLPLSS